jgi:hypothetical protein
VRGALTLAVVGVVLFGAARAAAAPPPPPPTVQGVPQLPPTAWIETRGGDRWLAFSDFCWTRACVDFELPQRRTDVPKVRLIRGEIVRFHLGFRPSRLALELAGTRYPLAARRVATWRVRGGSGYAKLVAQTKTSGGFHADYVARLVLR